MISSSHLKACAAQLGFSACGLAPAEPLPAWRTELFEQWIAQGCQGEMEYLARHAEKRADPRLLVEGAQTVVSLAVNYYPGHWTEGTGNEEDGRAQTPNAWRLARYAYGTDYHEVLKQMLRKLMAETGLEEGKDGRCFVDTAPIDEKYWAVRCGLGWQGRHSQLIVPQAGSFFFLGELILTHPADAYDEPIKNRCGNCRACIEACPTGALDNSGKLDARRCLSYLTIEHKGAIPEQLAAKMAPCIYGCDRCAEACPWNQRFASPTTICDLQPRHALLNMTPEGWQHLEVEQYRELFRKSAVKRAKYDGLMRNIQAVAMHHEGE